MEANSIDRGRRAFLRALAGSAGAALLGGGGCLLAPRRDDAMPAEAQELVAACWDGIDPGRAVDVHVHLVGLGTGGTGCWVNPRLTSLAHPVERVRFLIYRTAAGIDDLERADAQFVDRLAGLLRGARPHGRAVLLPFDWARREDGSEDREASNFHVPDDYALAVARAAPDLFLPAGSVHPYRPDAPAEVARLAAAGAVLVKWLPAAMRIDPSSPRCDATYEALAAAGLPLLTHAGTEQAVDAEEAQRLGNPLLLRRALDAGVTVIVAHAASLGTDRDLDLAASESAAEVESFELLLRLFREERYEGRLFADISALTQFNRCGRALRELLLASSLHERLLHGSDYPLPAIDPLIWSGRLVGRGFLGERERRIATEVFLRDPLTYDFVLKRLLRVREAGRTYRFAPVVFDTSRVIER